MRRRQCDKLHGRPLQLIARPAVIDRSPRIAICSYPTCIRRLVRRRNIAVKFDTEKLEQFGHPKVKKILKIRLLVSTEFPNVTGGQRPHDSIGRACIASRGKNPVYGTLV